MNSEKEMSLCVSVFNKISNINWPVNVCKMSAHKADFCFHIFSVLGHIVI